MSAKDLERLQRQQEANAIAIQRMQMRQNAEQARRVPGEQPEEEFYEPPQGYVPPEQQPRYNEVSPEQIAVHAANLAADQVHKKMENYNALEQTVTKRMKRLTEEFPALQDEGSRLVLKARDEYQRIAQENPSLDEATRYELAVKSAAASIGARPVNAPIDPNEDFTMPSSHNPARSSGRRSGKSRLTANILGNAKIMGINIDPNTKDGKQNLEELEESTARFNADADETMYKYR